MKKINKLALVLTKVVEVLHWISSAVMWLMAGASLFKGELVEKLWEEAHLTNQTVYGFSMAGSEGGGCPEMWVCALSFAAAAVIFSLMAMVFRNAHLILKRSGRSTPFQPDNVRMLREIGIFYLSIPLIGLTVTTLIRLAAGADALEMSVDVGGLATGILILCLSQFFAHGLELEQDLDGLM